MSSNAIRFGEVVRSWRERLDLSQLDVWQSGGPSNTTLTKIENGNLESLSRTTARKLDKGLRWMDGSAKTVWLGGDPTPLAESKIPDDVLAEIESAEISESTRAWVMEALEAKASREATERGVS